MTDVPDGGAQLPDREPMTTPEVMFRAILAAHFPESAVRCSCGIGWGGAPDTWADHLVGLPHVARLLRGGGAPASTEKVLDDFRDAFRYALSGYDVHVDRAWAKFIADEDVTKWLAAVGPQPATTLPDRDRLFCKALLATLDTRDVAKVLAWFNANRPDGPVLGPAGVSGDPKEEKS